MVEGDIRSPRLLIQEGAVVNGSIEMSKSAVPATTKNAPAANSPKAEEPERKSA